MRPSHLIAVASLLLVSGCTGGKSKAEWHDVSPAPQFSAGAAGAGDPYFPSYGNGGYDVTDYAITARYDPQSLQLSAVTTVTATATANLSEYHLDFTGLTVRAVTVDGKAAQQRRADDELIITPPAGIATGATFVTEVRYDGKPRQKQNEILGAGGFLATDDGAIVLGQPESATTWFPVNDHPSDKARYAFALTVPSGLTAIANGKPGKTSTEAGWTTWKWAESVPMASYLATAVIGKYRVRTGTHLGKPLYTAVAAALPAGGVADRSMAKTTTVADYLATIFGPYPMDAYGGVVVSDPRIRFALETQSRPVYGASFFGDDEEGTSVVVHELAHQWCGDSVAVARWQDIWLNEGFATYAEWLWEDHIGGQSVAEQFTAEYEDSPPAVWKLPPGRPGAAHLFDAGVYQRGAMTVQALRVAIGDKAFFDLVKQWFASKKDGNGSTAEFIALAEQVSGKKLATFFDAWLFTPKRPAQPRPA